MSERLATRACHCAMFVKRTITKKIAFACVVVAAGLLARDEPTAGRPEHVLPRNAIRVPADAAPAGAGDA